MQQKINDIIKKVEEDSNVVNSIVTDVVAEYTSDLDGVMSAIKRDVLEDSNPSIYTIEKYFIELSSALYYMCERVEKLGVYDSISKSKAQETYNNKYLEHQHSTDGKVGAKKPTVAESTAISENESIYDKTVNDLYSKAYKIVKNKVSSAETMVSTLSKILSHRMQESQMTSSQTERQILNEGDIRFV